MAKKRKTSKKKSKRKLKGKALTSARKNLKKARAARKNKGTKRKSRKKSKTKTKKSKSKSSKKTKSKKSKSKDMVFGKNILSNPTLKKAAIGVGTGTIVATALAFVAPQFAQNPLIKTGIAFLAGGPIGAVASLFLTGGLSGILGGGNGGTQSAGAGAA